MSKYRVTVGLEIHTELNTMSKAFCSCHTTFGAMPNSQVCPICLGMPGALPMINRKAVEYAIMAGLSLGSEISNLAVFERKNYFYPDLPKAYQISQLDNPICRGGGILLSNGKYIRFNRIHLEEDAGKLIHDDENNCTLIDFNRCGVPLIEMVTEPDFESGEEVLEFSNNLRQILIHTGVANCKMEEGGFRIDLNISVREATDNKLGTRVEIKNINSFKAIAQVIEYEKNRQENLLENGQVVDSETRGWDENLNETYVMRVKESENDYRYFADPSILPIEISDGDIERIRKKLPASINDVFEKYRNLGLEDNQIEILTNKGLISIFDQINTLVNNPKEVINWMLSDCLKLLKDYEKETLFKLLKVSDVAEILNMIIAGTITRGNGKVLMEEILNTGKRIKQLIVENDLMGDVNKIDVENFVYELLDNYPNLKQDYKGNKENVMNFFIGKIMKLTKGKARAEYIMPLISQILERE